MSKVFIVGSLNMDIVSYVARMPKPGETMAGEGFFTNCGGKGLNQAAAAAKLGARTYMIGAAGDDTYGAELKDTLNGYGADTGFVTTCEGSSGVAVIVVCKGQNSIILSGGANMKLRADYVAGTLRKNAKAGDILLTQLEVPLDAAEAALRTARELGMTTILNPAPAVKGAEHLCRYADIITPNETETEILTGVNPEDEVGITFAVKRFYGMGVKNVVITLGPKGVAAATGQIITPIPAVDVKVVDTTAAGDTFVGALAAELSRGASLLDACGFGVRAAALTCTKKGAAVSIPLLDEVKYKI